MRHIASRHRILGLAGTVIFPCSEGLETQIDKIAGSKIESRPLPTRRNHISFKIQSADSQLSPHVHYFARSKWLPVMVALCSLCAHLGCTLFPAMAPLTSNSAGPRTLPPIQTSPEAIQLDVFFVERPADDRLLATGVWKEVDQIGALSSETRETLRDNGFRVGIVGSNPPPAVQKLLGMAAEISTDDSDRAKPFMGHHHFFPPGVETQIATGVEHQQCEVLIRDGERTKTLEFERASCVLRMKAQRLQEGWVRVDFQPEIHHGESIMRPTATETGWAYRGGQDIDVRHAQHFHVMMNVGEWVLITATPDDDDTLGDRFFCHTDQGLKRQRVLIVRIAGSGQSPTNH